MTGQASLEVVGLGQASLDILGHTAEYPALDQKSELHDLLIQGGGPVATAMVTLARLGVPVAMVGAVADDQFGQQIRAGLEREGIDCRALKSVPAAISQVAFIVVDQQGHRNIFWHRGTAVPTLPEPPEALFPASVRILHLDGLHLEAAIAAARIARRLNIHTVLDAGTFRPGIESLLPLIDHLVVSLGFAVQMTGHTEPVAALTALAADRPSAVTVTCGKRGSYSRSPDVETFHQPAFQVPAVDTTGCGDVFHGGYIYGLLQGWDLRSIVRFATACAALKTRALGGRTAIPSLFEVTALLDSTTE